MKKTCKIGQERQQQIIALQDTLEIISGKWKILILGTLIEKPQRFTEIIDTVGISPRMLSRELQNMEQNRLITRTVKDTKPVAVIYAVTPYGQTLKKVFKEMVEWGTRHRQLIMAHEDQQGAGPAQRAALGKQFNVLSVDSGV